MLLCQLTARFTISFIQFLRLITFKSLLFSQDISSPLFWCGVNSTLTLNSYQQQQREKQFIKIQEFFKVGLLAHRYMQRLNQSIPIVCNIDILDDLSGKLHNRHYTSTYKAILIYSLLCKSFFHFQFHSL